MLALISRLRIWTTVVFVVFLMALTGAAIADDAKQPEVDQGVLMQAKMNSSQKVLEGLVTKDFDLIAKGAKELEKLSGAATFQRYRDPVYRHHGNEFRRQVQKLRRLAEDKNLEGASFTYMHSLTTCITCHEYVRDVIRVADAPVEQKGPFRLLGKLPAEESSGRRDLPTEKLKGIKRP
jgi:hypothetical protein